MSAWSKNELHSMLAVSSRPVRIGPDWLEASFVVVRHGYLEGYAGYAAAKEAIRSLTRTAAHEWGQFNIHVNVIAPPR